MNYTKSQHQPSEGAYKWCILTRDVLNAEASQYQYELFQKGLGFILDTFKQKYMKF